MSAADSVACEGAVRRVRDIRKLLGCLTLTYDTVIRERQSRTLRWSAGPMQCFPQLKLNLHWRGPRWSAGPLRCRTKACHSTGGLVSALAWFGSVLEAAVGGAPDDASQGCLLALSLPCLRVCVTIVQTCLTCCLGA